MVTEIQDIEDGIQQTDAEALCVDHHTLENLRAKLQEHPIQGVQLCMRPNSCSPAPEMIVAHSKHGYIRPHKHQERRESFQMLVGALDLVIFEEGGRVREVVHMDADHCKKSLFTHLTQPVFHTIIIRSEYAVFHESLSGPAEAEDIVYADWAPSLDEDGEAACEDYRKRLVQSYHAG